jgi:hypothetical protein
MNKIILILLTVGLFSCRPNGNYLEINNNDLYFTPAVDKEFIGIASEYLVSTEFFAQGGKSVQLDIINNIPVFRLVIKASVAQDSSTRETALAFGRIIQKDLYNKQPFLLHLCDKQFNTLKAFKFN